MLQPGAGFGGPFVEAEMDSLAQLASEKGISLRILGAAREINRSLPDQIVSKIAALIDNLAGKELGILGLASKPHTNSVAGSAAISLARDLMNRGAMVRAYDPVATPAASTALSGLRCCDNAYMAADGADALVVGTGGRSSSAGLQQDQAPAEAADHRGFEEPARFASPAFDGIPVCGHRAGIVVSC